MVTRAELRGEPLDPECYRANRTTHEDGVEDNRIFCYGLFREQSESEVCDKCLKCKAFVENAEPLKGE